MAEEKTKEVLELRVPTSVKSLIEALIFAAREPLTIKQMKDIYEGDGPQSYLRQLDLEEVETTINELNAEYESAEKSYRIVKIAGGFQFATLSSYADWIGRLYKEQGRRKLSQSGIESLAIIAYKQPVTKADIESIRGVNCDYVLKTLLEKELVTVVGRAHAPGRPLLYGTTREFLKHFGLNEITDLPRPREIEEILGESQFETERRMLEAQAGAEKMKAEEPEFKSRLPHIPKKKPELDTPVEIRQKSNQRELKTVRTTEITTGPEGEVAPPEHDTAGQLEISADLPVTPAKVDASLDIVPDVPQGDVGLPVDEAVPEEEMTVVPQVSVDEGVDGGTPDVELVSGPIENKIEAQEDALRLEEPPAPREALREPLAEQRSQAEKSADGIVQPVVNKTKWQTWKEKVQGFLKKIFG